MPYPRTGDHPEAVVKVLLKIIEKTPAGGATLEELKEAYREVKDREPSERTIKRIIRRINLLFDPLAYEKGGEEEEGPGASRVVEAQKSGGRTRYIFTVDLKSPAPDPNLALLLTLCLYPQKHQLLPDQFEVLVRHLFEGVLKRFVEWQEMKQEMEQ